MQETEEDKLAKRETIGRRETKRNVRLKLRKEVGSEEGQLVGIQLFQVLPSPSKIPAS